MFSNFIISAGEVKEAAAEKVNEAKDKAGELASQAQQKAEGKYYRI
jgi:vacuolar-type H+-ATPase subunit H